MKEIIIIAGPNGAGKTSFANEYLPLRDRPMVFVNADEIAREPEISNLSRTRRDFKAARKMLLRISELIASETSFMFETTLANLTYARMIPIWQSKGFQIELIYLRLPSVEHSIERVRKRVDNGGHDIPETVIRRRFSRSLDYLQEIYKPLVNEWYVWDSLEGEFKQAEAWDDQ